MARSSRRSLQMIKWDIRVVLALLIVLAIFLTLSFAAPSSTPTVSYDFGTAAVNDLAPGYTAVRGSLTSYPTAGGGTTFGWSSGGAGVQIFSDPGVSDRVQRDSNGGSSAATFRVSGLTPGAYTLVFVVGSGSTDVGTRIQVGQAARAVTATTGTWKSSTLEAETTDGTIDIQFAGVSGLAWAVNGLRIYAGVGSSEPPTFSVGVSPRSATVVAGETASFSIGLVGMNDYADGVELAVSGLAGGLAAQITPPEISTLPGNAVLRVVSQSQTPAAVYTLVLTATGTDANKTRQVSTVELTVTASGGVDQPPVDLPGGGQEPEPLEPDKSPEDIERDQALLDAFAREQANRVPNSGNLVELRSIDTNIQIPTLEIPKPATGFESFLQGLTRTGIIGIASDTAPIGQRVTEERPSFFQRIVKGLFPWAG